MNSKIKIGLFPALLALLWAPSTALAQRQEIIQLQADIINLEQRVAEIQRSLDERNSVVQDLVEQLFDRMVHLTDTVDRISDTVDQVQAGNDRLSGELRVAMSNLSSDVGLMDRTLDDLTVQVGAISQQMTSLSATTQELGSPENLLRTAQVDLIAGAPALARDGFTDFLRAFPGSPQADDAQFGLGQAYYEESLFDQAIIEYDLLLQRYPNSDKTRDALLRKGQALRQIGAPEQAREVFERVVQDFPETPQALRAREELNALEN